WFLVLLGPLPAALTDSTPHAIRSLLMLPGLVILVAFGVLSLVSNLGNLQSLKNQSLLLVACSLWLINIFYYLNSYYVISPYYQASNWQYGYEELYQKLAGMEDEYDQIIISNKYDQPHMFYAFFNQIDPKEYQQYAETAPESIGKYRFKRVESQDYEN